MHNTFEFMGNSCDSTIMYDCNDANRDMGTRMRCAALCETLANILKVLEQYLATMENTVFEKMLSMMDMSTASVPHNLSRFHY